MSSTQSKTVVVIGNGMVGHRFVEKMVEFDGHQRFKIVAFCEEPRAAYDRVGLTSFFAHRDAEKLVLARIDWYREHGVELHIGDRASHIDRRKQIVQSDEGTTIHYDRVVLATGSYPLVPPVDGIQKRGVFVYRTIEDLEKIIDYGKRSRRCAVIGGGLLGLEAAKAAYDLGLTTHVVEFAPRLMPRQLDDAGSAVLTKKIEELGVRVHLNKTTEQIIGQAQVEAMTFADGDRLDVDMIIVSAGIRPRDELARECGLETGPRGGVAVNDLLQTSDPSIFAIGEVALHAGMVYGLVAPGYDMAAIVARNLTQISEDPASSPVEAPQLFSGTDLSTKLKLMDVDVASFGDHTADGDDTKSLTFEDPFAGVYKKLVFDSAGSRLLGGILVGDVADYGSLTMLATSDNPLPCPPGELMGVGGSVASAMGGADAIGDDCQICSCNNVKKGELRQAIVDNNLTNLTEVKSCTKAGMGCGGCIPLVTDVFQSELSKAGITLSNVLCEHFQYSRQQLFDIVRIHNISSFADLIASYGQGSGCEICKPTVASILASLWNDNIVEPKHHTLQDTNDRFLANIQRGGLYSVVPRVPGGEIVPDKLITLGKVAKKYGLYTKITGGQRVDLFGAQRHQLPDIWEELIDAGFESGHAYGKSVRTVKSCVGSTWCRYGVQDSVGLAIRVEKRYRGIRAPHKIKFAVSGCVRECAEAQCKDVGLIATEVGYNLYVCGNGGATPRHADLLIADVDEEYAFRIIDRFLMYYIYTADKLTRTSVWLERLEGGIDYVRSVVIDDALGLCDELERRMQHLVDSYKCEWKEVVNDPEKRSRFRQFVNTDQTVSDIDFVDERGQVRPADWPKNGMPLYQITSPERSIAPERLNGQHPGASSSTNGRPATGAADPLDGRGNGHPNGKNDRGKSLPSRSLSGRWIRVGTVDDFPIDGGATIKYGDVQIAVYRFGVGGQWYACQNMCPHKNAFVLSRGIVGDSEGEPKVSCPLHKKPFSLRSGECLTGENYSLKVFPVKVESDTVLLQLPPEEQLNAILATPMHRIRASDCRELCADC